MAIQETTLGYVPVNRGAWASGTSYYVGNIVQNEYSTFICKTAHTGASADEPKVVVDDEGNMSCSSTKWDIVASAEASKVRADADHERAEEDHTSAVLTTAQTLTTAQKQQARQNIDVPSKEGFYEQMGVGYAKSMLGTGASVPAEFTRRTAGGTADIASGVASFKDINGNTIVWNQLVDEDTTEVTLVSGHKYYTCIGQTEEGVTTYTDSIVMGTGSAIAVSEGDMVFDLTKMTIASAISTPADFKALFPNDYYPYNAGQLLSLTAQKFVTDGFNQFDDDTMWAVGEKASDGSRYIQAAGSTLNKPVIDGVSFFPNTQYCIRYESRQIDSGVNARLKIRYTDNTSENCYINTTAAFLSGYVVSQQGKTIKQIELDYGSAGYFYIKNLCINIAWSGVRNGEFEPYWKEEKALPIPEEGLKSAGRGSSLVYDEISGGKLITKVGTRAYQSGDEDDDTLTTDKTNTNYPLTTPVETEIPDLDLNYRVDDFGTESIAPLTDAQGNPVTAPIIADVVYGPNVQDTIRRLPTNYLSIADYKTGITNLASALGTSLGKTIAVTWGGDNGSVPTFTITDNPTE